MSKPEIALKEIISYNNNCVDTKPIIRNYRYKENKILKLIVIVVKPYIFFYIKKIYSLIFIKGISDIKKIYSLIFIKGISDIKKYIV